MVCRHAKGDPNCTTQYPHLFYEEKYGNDVKRLKAEKKKLEKEIEAMSPNPKEFEIEDAVEVNDAYLVVKARFPSCLSCSYEGLKVIVYEGVGLRDAIKWQELDPHFRDPDSLGSTKIAPPPIARFPASETGWNDAIMYASNK